MDFDLIREQLQLKLDIVAKGLTRLGMRASPAYSLEVLDLFYTFYSPAQAKLQPLTDHALQMVHTALIQKGSLTMPNKLLRSILEPIKKQRQAHSEEAKRNERRVWRTRRNRCTVLCRFGRRY